MRDLDLRNFPKSTPEIARKIVLTYFAFVVQLRGFFVEEICHPDGGVSLSATQHFLKNNFSAQVSIYQQSVGLTGPLMTYVGHPRDSLAIFDF